jgi:stearoyl-CoA desaturase (delta-9 desaturase)
MNILFSILIMTHITIMCVTLYLHRSQAHRLVEFHPVIAHFMRFWLWLTTGMNTKEWVAVHRKHHQASDTESDPHSPKIYGIWRVLFGGAFLYVRAKKQPEILKLGIGTPDDWAERNVYSKHQILGILLLLLVNLLVFGLSGLMVWSIQMLWVPFWAAGVINGLAHWWGYRNYDVKDTSRNLLPIGIWIGGEELHNNHHGDPVNPKFSRRWFEFDIGWMYIRIFQILGFAKVRV